VILLQIDLTSGNESKIVYKGFYKSENTSIFTWSSFPTLDTIIGYAIWFVDFILTSKQIDYLVRIIRRILDFL
jgi:hypothetical protein